MKKDIRLAIVGATGVVGREVVKLLEERAWKLPEPLLIASPRSIGEGLDFCGRDVALRTLDDVDYRDADIWIVAAGPYVAETCMSGILDAGGIMIDLSERFRLDPEVPLVVPELNPAAAAGRKLLACPGAAATMVSLVLNALAAEFEITRVTACSLEPVSVRGNAGVRELEQQVKQLLTFQDPAIKVFNHQIAFNVLPQRGLADDSSATDYEQNTAREIRRMLGNDDLIVDFTAACVPVFYGHGISLALDVANDDPAVVEMATAALRGAPGVRIEDSARHAIYPMPVFAAGQDACLVGRIRSGLDCSNRLDLWIAADNVRRGAAMNAVDLVENIIKEL